MTAQMSLDDFPVESPSFSGIVGAQNKAETQQFDGATFETHHDAKRLGKQLQAVFDLMKDGAWRTPEQMEAVLGARWSSINARLRDLRKPQFGGHAVPRERVKGGQFRYRLVLARR